MSLFGKKDEKTEEKKPASSWKRTNPIEERKKRDAEKKTRVSLDDPSGQKAARKAVEMKAAKAAGKTDDQIHEVITKETKTQKPDETAIREELRQFYETPEGRTLAGIKEEKVPESKETLETIPLEKKQMTQAQEEVKAMGVDEGSSDEDVKNALLEQAQKNGLIEMNSDGTWRFRQYDSKASSTMRGIGTALSILVSYLSGGTFPPVNFYDVRSDNDRKAKEQYDSFMDNFKDVMAQLYGNDAIADYQAADPSKAKKVGEYNVAVSGKERTFEQSKEFASFQNELTKDLAEANADINASMLAREIGYLVDKGYTKQEIAEWVQRIHGQTAANAIGDTVGKYVGAGANAVGAVGGVVSDSRIKDFKRGSSYKKYNYVKRGK